jgi:hypothetical protein
MVSPVTRAPSQAASTPAPKAETLLAVAFAGAAGAGVDVLAADPSRRQLAATFGASWQTCRRSRY